MREKGIVSRGVDKTKSKELDKCGLKGGSSQEGQTTKNKVGVGSLAKEELEWENKTLQIDC